MIEGSCQIYVQGKGFVNVFDITVGDEVYVLDNFNVRIENVQEIHLENIFGKINVVDSGAHNVDSTLDTRFLYCSEKYGTRYLDFKEIKLLAADKGYNKASYIPILSYPYQVDRQNFSVRELEYVARMIAVENYNLDSFDSIVKKCTGADAIILIDMLEFWCSDIPGDGWFNRVSVKSRSHRIKNKHMVLELCRIAVLAGYTASITYFDKGYFLKVNYESMPIPGSRPKNQKYYQKHYSGHVFNVNAKNLPILGISKNRCFFLPTTSSLNMIK